MSDRWTSPSGPPNRPKPSIVQVAVFWALLLVGALAVSGLLDRMF